MTRDLNYPEKHEKHSRVAKHVSNFSLIFHDGKSILMGVGGSVGWKSKVVLYFIVIFVSVCTKAFTITIECFHRHWKVHFFVIFVLIFHFPLHHPPFPSMSEHFYTNNNRKMLYFSPFFIHIMAAQKRKI